VNRRSVLRIGVAAAAMGPLRGRTAGNPITPAGMRRIATEEAFTVPAVAEALSNVVATRTMPSLELELLKMIYGPTSRTEQGARLLRQLLSLDDERLEMMDESGVSMHVTSLTAPGVQMFDADTATELARLANDLQAEAIGRHPERLAGLASMAPHSPRRAAREMERAINGLGLNGFVINSHTNGEYLDDPKFWPLFEAAEGLDRPIYIHPRAPSQGMAAPFSSYGMEAAMWGYAMETGTHALRLMLNGVFDQFPRLQIVLGHMGEGIPYWLTRIDHFHGIMMARGRTPKTELKPSEYFRRNFAITTSGMESPEVLDFCIKVLGVENVMWAIDYPYQATPPAVAFMDGADLPVEQKALVYHGNAERIFGIDTDD
jgi:5-carboxyvanillate decarboxylase